MKKLIKRIICFILVAVMAIPCIDMQQAKADEVTNKWDDYEFVDNRLNGTTSLAYCFNSTFEYSSFNDAKTEILYNFKSILYNHLEDYSIDKVMFRIPVKIKCPTELSDDELQKILDDFNTYIDLQPVNNPDEAFFRLICKVEIDNMSTIKTFHELNFEDGYYVGKVDFNAQLKTSENANKMREEMPEVIKSLDIEGKSEFDKIFAISKWISENITYGSAPGYNDQLAEDTFVSRTGVCSGYANLFVYMANYVGLKSYSVSCVFHRIALVAIDDVFYYVDPTAFDPYIFMSPQTVSCPFLEGSNYYLGYEDDCEYQLKPYEDEQLIFDRINIAEDSYLKDNSICKGNHTFKYTEDRAFAPGCSGYGYRYNHCTKCAYNKIIITDEPTGHNWEKSKVIREATCMWPEEDELMCTKCKHTKQAESGDPLGHDYVRTVTKEPSCEEYGVATYTCSRCDASYIESIPRYPHMDPATVKWVTVKKPTCTEEGLQTKTCPYCGEVQKKSLKKFDHDWGVEVVKEADCTHGEIMRNVCKRCGMDEGFEYELGEPKGHTYDDGVIIEEGNCANPFNTVAYNCKVCGYVKKEEVYADFQHKWDEGIKDTVNGVIIYKCKVCGDIKTEPYDEEDDTTTIPVTTTDSAPTTKENPVTEEPTTEKQTEQVSTTPNPTTVKPTETVSGVEPTTTKEVVTDQTTTKENPTEPVTTKDQTTPDVTEKETETTVPVTTTVKSEEEASTTYLVTENPTTKAEETTVPETITMYPFKIHIGDTIKKKGITYKVSKVDYGNNSEAVVIKTDKKKISYNIPDTIKIKGVQCKVVEIKDNTFKKCLKLKKITVGKNIKIIGKNSFYGCKKLKNIVVKSTVLTTVEKNAVKGTDKKLIIKVPKKKIKAYKVIFKKAGLGKKMKIK